MSDGMLKSAQPEPIRLNKVVANALEQQQAYQKRIDNQRKIIERYDGFRRWVLREIVPTLNEVADELEEVGADKGAADMRALAQRAKLLGENPPEDWTS